MAHKKTVEPFWWALFGAGGVMSAMFIPALMFYFVFAVPFGLVDDPDIDKLSMWLSPIYVKIAVLGIMSLSLFHWAHRFRFTLYDGLQVKHLNELIALFCYGGAIAGTLLTAYLLFF